MGIRTLRIFAGATAGVIVAFATNRLDAVLIRRGIAPASTLLDDLIIGCVAALCVYGWVSLFAIRYARLSSAERFRQEGATRERTRIACDIHDTLAQGFAGIIVNLEAASDLEAAEARTLTDRALRIGREGLAEARALLKEFRSLRNNDESFDATLTHLANTLVEGTYLKVSCSVDEIPRQLSLDTETELLRIIREAITNVVRHADATDLRVTLRADEQHVHLCVEDNGRGFVLANTRDDAGFGLTSMRERARHLGGACWLFSQAGQGTAVIALIPISSETDSRSTSCNNIPFESSSPTTTRSSVTDSVQS